MIEEIKAAPCQCSGPGYCDRMQRNMPAPLWQQCKSNAGFRQTLDDIAAGKLGQVRQLNVGTCRYEGDDTGQLRDCIDGCHGRVQLKVFDCHHPLHATDPFTTKKDCQRCKDFAAR